MAPAPQMKPPKSGRSGPRIAQEIASPPCGKLHRPLVGQPRGVQELLHARDPQGTEPGNVGSKLDPIASHP